MNAATGMDVCEPVLSKRAEMEDTSLKAWFNLVEGFRVEERL